MHIFKTRNILEVLVGIFKRQNFIQYALQKSSEIKRSIVVK